MVFNNRYGFASLEQSPVNQESAVKRLMRDLRELEATHMDTIVARPLPNNLFEWHANLLAPQDSPFHGIVTHLILNFPADYPHSPPRVKCCTHLTHSHIFSGYICLDMLQPYSGHGEYSWGAWSTAYTVSSLLRQLQIFFFEKEFITHYGTKEKPETDIQRSLQYKCQSCSHNAKSGNPWPWDNQWPQFNTPTTTTTTTTTKNQPQPQQKSGGKKNKNKIVRYIPDDCLLNIFSYLPITKLNNVARVNPQWNRISTSPSLTVALDCNCFHSKQTYEEDVLGIGINLGFTQSGVLQYVDSPLDLISKTAFDEGVRVGVWHKPFEFFLPLYINKLHASRAIPLLEKSILTIYQNVDTVGTSKYWVTLFVDLLCKLMSSMIVEIMKDNLHASFVALEGYCYFHRWLIYLCETYPQNVQLAIDNAIQKFVSSESQRCKEVRPNLGEFLPLLSVSKYGWKQVGKYVCQEALDRNSLWLYLKNDKSLKNYSKWRNDPTSVKNRVNLAFETCKVSARLIMFHKMALDLVKGNRNINEIAREYDYRFGRPSNEIQKRLQSEIFAIQQCTTYMQYFKYVLNFHRSVQDVNVMLNDSMKIAIKKGYLSQENPQSTTQRNDDRGSFRGRGGMVTRGRSSRVTTTRRTTPTTTTTTTRRTTTVVNNANYNPYQLLSND